MTNTDALITARRERAKQSHDRALQAIRTMTRAREHITFSAVAIRAGVSREYLYRTPELADKIRSARIIARPQTIAAQGTSHEPVIAALRDHIRRLETNHALQVTQLREENARLRRELETTLGKLLAEGHPTTDRTL